MYRINLIDASGEHDSLPFDLNNLLCTEYNFTKQFDIVSNLGTFEHVFNIANCFENMHNVCKRDGLMLHVIPCNCK